MTVETTVLIWAVTAGIGVGLGLILALGAVPAWNQPTMTERIAPYVRSTAATLDERESSLPAAVELIAPAVRAAMRQLDRFGVDSYQLARRLDAADAGLTVSQYRLQQLAASALGAAGGAVLSLVSAVAHTFNVLLALVCIVASSVLGVVLRDAALSARVAKRRGRILEEFPVVAEMIALAVSAGETAPAAFERVSRLTHGEFATELQRMLAEIRAGTPFAVAARNLDRRVDAAPISRFLDGVLVALDRGTPMAEVMRAQAADVREMSKRDLMESAGQKEIGMLVPLVFGILPLAVIFAAYPGFHLLSLGI
ncbi:type II secretion system F family protein [Nesterenkonia alba]|uniref:type II secretion system F family protein n=1 Tax=Nesterenkonia alba TaxID=515814 RepID=UPI0003B7018F|nr:type II secretion system F family protein [Nesterenkonia alba]